MFRLPGCEGSSTWKGRVAMKSREFAGLFGGVAALPTAWQSAARPVDEQLPTFGDVSFDLSAVEGKNFRAE
jgi:hypothetical protein